MKKQLIFLCTILVLSGLFTPILGVTSARYKALWAKQVAERRASKAVDTSQTLDSESLQSEEQERTVTPAVQELTQIPQKKEKSFFEKYASKLAATLVGAAIVGAYELFAESNPDTVPMIGLRDMFGSLLNSVLSLFGFGAENVVADADIAAEKVVMSDISADVPTHQATTISTPTVTTQPEVIQPTKQSTTIPVVEELTTTAISTTSNIPVAQPVEQPKIVVVNQPVDKGVVHVSGEDDSFKTVSFSDDEDVQNEAEIWSEDQGKVVLVSPKNVQSIEQQTVTITPDDKGAPLVSGEDDSVYYSMSRSEDESTEDEKKVIENKEETKPVVQKSEPKNGDVQAVGTALDKLIAYTRNTGNWFLNLFNKNNKTPYNTHVDILGNTIRAMEQEVASVVVSDNNPILQATKDLATFLIGQLEVTLKTLKGFTGTSLLTPNFVKAGLLGTALQALINEKIEQEQNNKLQNLYQQLTDYPELKAKVIQLQKVITDCGNEIKKTGGVAGLYHRLNC